MREFKLPESGPKRKLFDAAACLFAERGFQAVSVRDICAAAGTNIAAVNYHFGSREGLLGLVAADHLAPLNDERLLRLEVLEKNWGGKPVPLEEILDAFVRPIVTRAQKSGLSEVLYCRLLGLIFQENPEIFSNGLRAQSVVLMDRFKRLFAKTVSSLSEEDLEGRIQLMVGCLIHLLARPGGVREDGKVGLEGMLGRFIRFSAAGLRGGVSGEVEPEKKVGPQAMFDF